MASHMHTNQHNASAPPPVPKVDYFDVLRVVDCRHRRVMQQRVELSGRSLVVVVVVLLLVVVVVEVIVVETVEVVVVAVVVAVVLVVVVLSGRSCLWCVREDR